jgi:NDP-sugar pyrophosphorylase family protein
LELISSEQKVISEAEPTSAMSDIRAVLLVGGMGTRLRSVVPSTPKPLALVGNRSFLELLIRQLRSQGIRRLIMCTGYLAEQIESEFGDGHAWDVSIQYARELQPLGTAGAVGLAGKYLRDSPDFLVMNGDSFIEMDFWGLIQFHRKHEAVGTLSVRKLDDTGRYGTVHVGADGRVISFVEKSGDSLPGLVNAGVYAFNRGMFEHIPKGIASLEKDVFPRLLEHGLFALEQRGMFIDIGTPQDYWRAQELSDRLYDAALQKHPMETE